MNEDTRELIPFRKMVPNLPDATTLRRVLRESLERAFAAARAEQGVVQVPEDTFAVQRSLAQAHELFGGYAAAFTDARKQVAKMQEEQLVDAVGEQGGTPNQGLTVPDAAGDVRLSLDMATGYTFDLDQIIKVVAVDTVEHAIFESDDPGAIGGSAMVEAGIRRLLELGKFEPQVTKVRAYAKQVAREGDDGLAAVLNGAGRRTSTYRGVKFTRAG